MTTETYKIQTVIYEASAGILFMLKNVKPAKVYPNFFNDRTKIRKDHQKKNGPIGAIYMLVLISDPTHFYVGQSINLVNRMNNYLNGTFLVNKKNKNSPIVKGLLKHGSAGYALVIIEYVKASVLNEREVYWISLLKPYYNVSPGGGSSIGVPHTKEVKALLRTMRLGTTQSDETKKKISDANKGVLHHFYGKSHKNSSLDKMSWSLSKGVVYVYDSFFTLVMVLPSINFFAQRSLTNSAAVSASVDSGKLFRGGWYLMSSPMVSCVLPLIIDHRSQEAFYVIAQIGAEKHVKKAVFLFDNKTREFVRRYDGVVDCAKALNSSHTTVSARMAVNGVLGPYIVSAHRLLT